jgi:NADH oxidase (H2O-forming)
MKNNTVKISDSVHWIGILDRDLVTFDVVMETKYGTTYNSYFIDADKKTIIDTCKEKYKDDYINKIKQFIDPSEIEYIIVNHTEPDHSGSVSHLLKLAPKAQILGSRQAINYLNEIIGEPFNHAIVKDGDVIDLGNKKLRVISAPNLHWPDSIYTYLEEEKILFTCDSFGAHFCDERIFDDLVGDYYDSFKYYFDVILKPFSKFLLQAIEKIKPIDIATICPGHGPILRSHWKTIVEISGKLAKEYMAQSENNPKNILIAYVSAYGYTRQIAEAIMEGIMEAGQFNIDFVDIEHILAGDLEEKIIGSHAILVGSPTINQNTLLPIYKMFALINPIRDKGKPAAAFGSYGWSGEAVKIIENQLRILKLNVLQEGIAARFCPNETETESIRQFGFDFASKLTTESK